MSIKDTSNMPTSVQTAYNEMDMSIKGYDEKFIPFLTKHNGNRAKVEKLTKTCDNMLDTVTHYYTIARKELVKANQSTNELDARFQQVTQKTEQMRTFVREAVQGSFKYVPPKIEPPTTQAELGEPKAPANTDEPTLTENQTLALQTAFREIELATKGVTTKVLPRFEKETTKQQAIKIERVVRNILDTLKQHVEHAKKELPKDAKELKELNTKMEEVQKLCQKAIELATAAQQKPEAPRKITPPDTSNQKVDFSVLDQLPPVGIKNENGDDCFVNTMMQFIIHVPELRELIFDDNAIDSEDMIIVQLRNLINSYYEVATGLSEAKLLSVSVRAELPSDFHKGQHDATEALQHVLSHFKTQHLQTKYKNVRVLDQEQAVEATCAQPLIATNHTLSSSLSLLITDIDIYSEVAESSMFSSFFSSAKQKVAKPLEYSFQKTMEHGEVSSDDPIYYWETTDHKTYVSRFTGGHKEVEAVPNQLFLRLNRYNRRYGRNAKITDEVIIPTSFRGRELKAFATHNGTAYGGHWTTCVKKGDQWYSISDSSTRKIEEKEALELARTSDLFYFSK